MNYQNYPGISSYSKLDFPKFNGEDLKSWLFKVDKFFDFDNIDGQKSGIGCNSHGGSIQWHQSFMRCNILPPGMREIERFGADYDDPMEEIKKIANWFCREQFLKPPYLSCTELLGSKFYKQFPYPTTNSGPSYKRTSDQKFQSKPLLSTPAIESSVSNKGFTRRRLSIEEMNDKRAQGLCYFCPEKYAPGHKCKNLKQLYLLEVEELKEELTQQEGELMGEVGMEMVEVNQPLEQMEISAHALNGSLGFRTLRVTGYHSKKPLNILVDTGSSHNFMDPELAKTLGCATKSTTPQMVTAANGNMIRVDKVSHVIWLLQGAEFAVDFLLLPLGSCEVVLGVQWLLTLGDIKMNFNKLTMEFWYKGKKHLLRGNQSQLCMIQVVPTMCTELYALETKEEANTDPRILAVIQEFRELFAEPTQLPPSKGVFDHRIVLHNGIVQPSCSPFASPVVLVGKKDGTWRLCVDYRDLNKHTVKNKFPIPIVEDLLDELGGSTIFSKIDLRAGYHQLRMAEEDIPKTAFRTHSGHFEYLVMPFGLSNAPATFQGLMNTVFQKFLRKSVLVFFDDILICKTVEDHLLHLRSVFVEMKKHQLLAKESKCFFGVARIEYLGHFITKDGVSTDPQKISADSFKWSTLATSAFEKLKEALTKAPVLALPDANKTFVLETDASGFGIGAVLMQEGHPIAFISKTLSNRHAAMSVYDRELLAIVHAVSKWSQYLLGQRFIIRTDQKALKFLMEQKLHTNSQLMWLTKLMPFDYVIEYKKGVENKVVDALSMETDADLKAIVAQLQAGQGPTHFSWVQNQLRRKGKLVVGRVPQQISIISLGIALQGGHSGVEKGSYLVLLEGHKKRCQSISMDFIDGLPKSKSHEVILVVVDSDRDVVFLSSFWQELFALQGVQLNTSTAYHPQSDGQTECYTDHTYEALYGRPPPLHLPYLPGESDSAEVDNTLLNREFKLQLMKHHLMRAQLRMKQQADSHRSDRNFEVGDWVYFKVQPYRQVSIATHPYHKLAAKFYGPFQQHSRFTLQFMCPCLRSVNLLKFLFHLLLILLNCPQPEAILQRRMVKRGNKAVAQVLVKWHGLSLEFFNSLKTRFSQFDLEVKDLLMRGVLIHELVSAVGNELVIVEFQKLVGS
ncbi:uncharacterized protein LOC132032198 [Lycium ferocissimum]|uniref:uncharacterized protein LOC132032198 n=1 Tax=Lycium ferocissimum TaxID=112874 RepID=UPI0028156813|nr:uncharacterized protein LOC132032198 [Lycium ferocissimum]